MQGNKTGRTVGGIIPHLSVHQGQGAKGSLGLIERGGEDLPIPVQLEPKHLPCLTGQHGVALRAGQDAVHSVISGGQLPQDIAGSGITIQTFPGNQQIAPGRGAQGIIEAAGQEQRLGADALGVNGQQKSSVGIGNNQIIGVLPAVRQQQIPRLGQKLGFHAGFPVEAANSVIPSVVIYMIAQGGIQEHGILGQRDGVSNLAVFHRIQDVLAVLPVGEGKKAGFGAAHPGDACLRQGKDLTIVSYGVMINEVMAAAELLHRRGLEAEILKPDRICPLDMGPITASADRTGAVFVVEDCARQGSLSQEIFSALAAGGKDVKCAARNLGDGFVTHGSRDELLRDRGLDAQSLADWMTEVLDNG